MSIPQKNAIEWSVFWLSLALVLAVIGVLIYDVVEGDGGPPAVSVTPGQPVARGDLLEVPVLVENRGEQAAQDVLVAVTVRQAGGAEETAELTLPLLPGRGSESGVVAVRLAGAVAGVEGHVVGYTIP